MALSPKDMMVRMQKQRNQNIANKPDINDYSFDEDVFDFDDDSLPFDVSPVVSGNTQTDTNDTDVTEDIDDEEHSDVSDSDEESEREKIAEMSALNNQEAAEWLDEMGDDIQTFDNYISDDDLDADGFTDSDDTDDSENIKSDRAIYEENNTASENYYNQVQERRIHPLKSMRSKIKEEELVRTKAVANVSVAALEAMKMQFPQEMSNADLISAFVYVHTAADKTGTPIKLSEKAAYAVKKYSGDNAFFELDNRLGHIERMIVDITDKLRTIETAVAYLISERLWGQNQAMDVTPKTAQFRDSRTLDTLSTLRKQGEQQHRQDEIDRGRPKRNK